MTSKIAFLFTLVSLLSPVLAATNQFQHWYPEYRHIFQRILRQNCSDEYAFYLAGRKNFTRFEYYDRWIGAVNTSQLAFPPASCVLDHTSEWMKFNMAAAAVLLGLTPSILGALGPSVEEMSSLFIIARRPLLGICLAAGAPSLYPFRTFDYKEAIARLQDRNPHVRPRLFTRSYQYLVMIVEFIFAIGAIANNVTNSYQLGMQTSCVFAPQLWFLPILWAFLSILTHLFSALALRTRVNCERPYKTFIDWLRIQFTPIAEQKPLRVEPCEETRFSLVVAWWVSCYNPGLLIFGTITFSSLIFITVRDALAVIARYLTSLLVCRAILMYELGVLRAKYREEYERPESDQELQALRTKPDERLTLAQTWSEHGADAQEVRDF
ncbi:hypothetical protein GJ744_010341 [Endocarpon pusillum]|uniref:Autophagy-related protein n=1 Tax=Endocarpon pusillum TaxID=364733 RepID=A0A8H7E3Q8_9EURO|nr:hypothetical protein GJ744_010341 [Endocarpon pusillum]